jgi:hypothetical protein
MQRPADAGPESAGGAAPAAANGGGGGGGGGEAVGEDELAGCIGHFLR